MKIIKILYPGDEPYHGGKGQVKFQRGADPSKNERAMISWVHRNIGGDILALKIIDKKCVNTPDIVFRGVEFDIKHTAGTLATLDYHLRRAAKQTGGGGAFTDITGAKYPDEEAIGTARKRMLRSNLAEVYIVRSARLVAHLVAEQK